MRVLIAEDNPDLSRIFMLAFARFHYEVLIARDGQEALDIMDQVKPDLLILDINMPRVNGLEVLKRVRARADLKQIKIIVVTGNVIAGHSPEVEAADLLLIKPVSLPDLLRLAERLLTVSVEATCPEVRLAAAERPVASVLR
jgi:chemosensory pili system protein ChpA (sensor histidine kinase/response regulator)